MNSQHTFHVTGHEPVAARTFENFVSLKLGDETAFLLSDANGADANAAWLRELAEQAQRLAVIVYHRAALQAVTS